MTNKFESNIIKFHERVHMQKLGNWRVQICECTRQGLKVPWLAPELNWPGLVSHIQRLIV